MKKIIFVSLFLLPLYARCADASAATSPDLKIFGKTHTTAAYNSFSGPGSQIKNLANSYDMTFFEYSWGGRQTSFNGSGITTNTNFPLTNGEALTNNTQLGLSKQLSNEVNAGASAELYSLIGNRTVGRAYGQELPWDNFPREDGVVQPHRFNADLYNAFLEGNRDEFKYKIVGGSLSPKELPEFTRTDMNQVKLGSLVYRAPVTNESYFEKSDWKLEEGRHPLRGTDIIVDQEYVHDKHFHGEFFTGATEPTPITDIERDSYGGRISADIQNGNIGLSYIYNDGLRPISGYGEYQENWSIDSSYTLTSLAVPYFTFARTAYDRADTGESHTGDAYVAGLRLKFSNAFELKGQFQSVGENYDLMAIHKIEHYPSNFQGLNMQGSLSLSKDVQIQGIAYYLEQIKTATTASDTLFGDSYFTSSADSKKGKIGVERLGLDYKLDPTLSFRGYVEHSKFQKNTPSITTWIDKDVYNFYGHMGAAITPKLSLETGFRHFFCVGNWQTLNFRSSQDVPEAAIKYQFGKDNVNQLYLIYHFMDFTDNNDASQGLNDYHGHQVFAEIKIVI